MKNVPYDPGFEETHRDWLDDYCLFMALADHFGTDSWTEWPKPIRRHEAKSLAAWKEKLADKIDYHCRLQVGLHKEYNELKLVASSAGVKIIGDIPFYLPLNSPLVWAYQDCFLINQKGGLPYVSGVEGSKQFIRQVWGHPLYDWSKLPRVLKLWKIRLAYAACLYDWARLDSAISFYVYGKMNSTNETLDVIATGPGDRIFVPLIKYGRQLGLYVFCEDITDYDLTRIHKTMARYEIPGVFVFTLDQSLENLDMLDIHYTSDHDSMTLLGFLQNQDEARKVRQFLQDRCRRLILPLQDWLLTTDRVNTPGTISPDNWSYTVDLIKLKAP